MPRESCDGVADAVTAQKRTGIILVNRSMGTPEMPTIAGLFDFFRLECFCWLRLWKTQISTDRPLPISLIAERSKAKAGAFMGC